MAVLSTKASLAACLKMTSHPLGGGHCLLPAQHSFHFLIAVTGLFPGSLPVTSVEDRWQLAFGPVGIELPQIAKAIAHGVRNVNGPKWSHVFFVLTQEPAAGGQVIVNHVKNLPLDPRHQSGEGNGFHAVINVGER